MALQQAATSLGLVARTGASLLPSTLVPVLSRTQTRGFAKGDAAPPDDRGKAKMLIDMLYPGTYEPPERTEEELAEAKAKAAEFNRMSSIDTALWQKDIALKIKLRDEAVAALPADMQEMALEEDDAFFPSKRLVWTDTPPTSGWR